MGAVYAPPKPTPGQRPRSCRRKPKVEELGACELPLGLRLRLVSGSSGDALGPLWAGLVAPCRRVWPVGSRAGGWKRRKEGEHGRNLPLPWLAGGQKGR